MLDPVTIPTSDPAYDRDSVKDSHKPEDVFTQARRCAAQFDNAKENGGRALAIQSGVSLQCRGRQTSYQHFALY